MRYRARYGVRQPQQRLLLWLSVLNPDARRHLSTSSHPFDEVEIPLILGLSSRFQACLLHPQSIQLKEKTLKAFAPSPLLLSGIERRTHDHYRTNVQQ